MTIGDYLKTATKTLFKAGIGTARLDVLVLLEDLLGRDRALILAHPEQNLSDTQLQHLDAQVARRKQHVPLAYLRGKTEFYGRDFLVNEQVLEPRPESEMMIDLLKKTIQPTSDIRLVDVGSGSGCLGITAALELSLVRTDFIDIDPATLAVARENASRYKVVGKFIEGDLLGGDSGPYDVVLANLPYVPDTFHINEAAMREPNIAIFGGHDGLDPYRRLFEQLAAKNWKPQLVLAESLPPQHQALTAIANNYGFSQKTEADFIQVFVPSRG